MFSHKVSLEHVALARDDQDILAQGTEAGAVQRKAGSGSNPVQRSTKAVRKDSTQDKGDDSGLDEDHETDDPFNDPLIFKDRAKFIMKQFRKMLGMCLTSVHRERRRRASC